MKGVVLAGGWGTRLQPLTLITNKHLLPVGHRPMVEYPLRALSEAEIDEVLLVTGGNDAGHFLKYFGSGRDLGLRSLYYAHQDVAEGIADALLLVEDFAHGDNIAVVLGDNIFDAPLGPFIKKFHTVLAPNHHAPDALILAREHHRPKDYGVVQFDSSGLLQAIREKPEVPPSRFIVTGVYIYSSRVFELLRGLKPSSRGEYEISDLHTELIKLQALVLDYLPGWWCDAGTFEGLREAQEHFA